jgi:hypothetical protein
VKHLQAMTAMKWMAHHVLPTALVRIPASIGASAAVAFGRNPGSSTPVIVGPFFSLATAEAIVCWVRSFAR